MCDSLECQKVSDNLWRVSRHCEENLLFWLEAEDFKDIPGKDFLKIRARKIVNKYINEDSKQQVRRPIEYHERRSVSKVFLNWLAGPYVSDAMWSSGEHPKFNSLGPAEEH